MGALSDFIFNDHAMIPVNYANVLTSRSRGRYAKFGADTGRYQRRFDLQILKRLASAPV
jgi:hypothetical protein